MKKNGLIIFLLIVILFLSCSVVYLATKNIKSVNEENDRVADKVNYDKTLNVILDNETHKLSYVKKDRDDTGIATQYTLDMYFDDKLIYGDYKINEDSEITTDTVKGTFGSGEIDYLIISFNDASFIHHYIISNEGKVLYDAGGTSSEGLRLKLDNKLYRNSDITISKDENGQDKITRIERVYSIELGLIHEIDIIQGSVSDRIVGAYQASEYTPYGK